MKNQRDHSSHPQTPAPSVKADPRHAGPSSDSKQAAPTTSPARPADSDDQPAKPGTTPIIASPPKGAPDAKPAVVTSPAKV